MKELVVISGKGGTGKTSIVASFAALAQRPVVADCDVDAADLHLVLDPVIQKEQDFIGGKSARIDEDLCTQCGRCHELCRFGAILVPDRTFDSAQASYRIDPIACEGCGVCAHFCPADAILFEDCVNGQWFISDTRHGPMVHARLGIAQENSGKLVTLVKGQARRIADEGDNSLVIVDGAPGIGCPVISSVTGADLVLIVSEPSVSGEHDFLRVADLAAHFHIPAAICINKFDLNPQMTEQIESQAKRKGLHLAGRVRYDKVVTKAQVHKLSVVEYTQDPVTGDIRSVWERIQALL
jgi:MinD superfamily P-loop ATPase